MNDHEIKDAIRKVWDHASKTYDSNPHYPIGTQQEKDAWKQELSRNLPPTPQKVLESGAGQVRWAFYVLIWGTR